MIIGGRRAPLLLFVGDLAALAVSLYLALWLRYGTPPALATLEPYVSPFTFLFALWLLVFYSSGLYSKRMVLFASRLPDALIKTQLANIIFAALFFFFIPAFGIAPKTILALYFVVSLALILVWRLALYPRLTDPRERMPIVLVGKGSEAEELVTEVNANPRYPFIIEKTLVPDSPEIPSVARRYPVVRIEDLYEEVFDRVPLSTLEEQWFAKNVAATDPFFYVAMKRTIDIIGGLMMGVITAVIAPIIYLANRIEGPGPLFLVQERFGLHGETIKVYKFRSMQKNIAASAEFLNEGENRVTKVGAFLRHTSLDEFPQFVNVLRGEISLVGPRNDILGLGKRFAEALPYYEARYTVTPGITGWAQINQQYEQGNASPQSIEETKTRLAYDFYYLKHRSLGLDVMIALKTFKRMFFRLSSW